MISFPDTTSGKDIGVEHAGTEVIDDDRLERLTEALRTYGATYAQLGREFAASEGLHTSDATALLEILAAEERGTPLSPARLSERIGLTFGATSTLLNRLEAAGHVARSRVHADRRIVSLHSTQGVHQLAGDFFGPLGRRLAHVMQAYPPEVLDQFESLLHELRDSMEGYIEERADGATSPEPTTP